MQTPADSEVGLPERQASSQWKLKFKSVGGGSKLDTKGHRGASSLTPEWGGGGVYVWGLGARAGEGLPRPHHPAARLLLPTLPARW